MITTIKLVYGICEDGHGMCFQLPNQREELLNFLETQMSFTDGVFNMYTNEIKERLENFDVEVFSNVPMHYLRHCSYETFEIILGELWGNRGDFVIEGKELVIDNETV